MSFITSSLIKSFVGFDALFDEINKVSELKEQNYPAYNLEKLELDKFKITIAVAGFSIDQLSVEVMGSLLIVKTESEKNFQEIEYIHKGIAQRPFIKKFRLESNLQVTLAELKEGMLSIYLNRVIPEESKPVKIKINA